jgi:hypothetical protein
LLGSEVSLKGRFDPRGGQVAISRHREKSTEKGCDAIQFIWVWWSRPCGCGRSGSNQQYQDEGFHRFSKTLLG